MDWERLAEVEAAELECSEALLDSAYEFLAVNELSEQAARAPAGPPSQTPLNSTASHEGGDL